MNFIRKHFVEVKHGTKVTYSESDLRKLDKTYEKEVLDTSNRRVRSPMEKVLQQAYLTQLRDYAYEKILDSHLYTFSHLLVVPNPYDIVKQSALLLFNSTKELKVRYRVIGDVPEADFIGETDFTTRHRVPIMGLYLARSNRIELEMINREGEVVKRRQLRIYVSESPKKISDVFENDITHEERTKFQDVEFPFLLVNGLAFNPIAVDCEGKIRYSVQLRTNNIGMIPLEDGRFLYEDRTANRMSGRGAVMPCRYHEMDYMGRVYCTYLLDFPLCGVMAQNGNSLFAVTWSDNEHLRDCLVEIDRLSGEVKKKIDFAKVLGEEYRTRKDWIHLSKIVCDGEELLLVLGRLHTVLKYDWKQEKIIWVLAPKQIWENTPVSPYVLQGDRPAGEVCWKPEDAMLVESFAPGSGISEETSKAGGKTVENLALYQIKNNTDIRIFPKKSKDSSFVCLKIEKEKRRFQTIAEYKWIDCALHGSSFLSKDKKGILLCAGKCRKGAEGKGQISELDVETGKELRTLYAKKIINTIWQFKPDIFRYGEGVPVSRNVVFGNIAPPEVFTGSLPEPEAERVPKECFSNSRICEELYLFSMLPGTISKVYLIGENHAYVQDYTGLGEKPVKFSFAISLKELEKDTYRIYAELEEKVYRIKNEIRIVE